MDITIITQAVRCEYTAAGAWRGLSIPGHHDTVIPTCSSFFKCGSKVILASFPGHFGPGNEAKVTHVDR